MNTVKSNNNVLVQPTVVKQYGHSIDFVKLKIFKWLKYLLNS